MTAAFTESDWHALAAIVFRDDYPGNATARGIVEDPAGAGGRALDSQKRYAHVAAKYWDNGVSWEVNLSLRGALSQAWRTSCEIATQLGVPPMFRPSFEHGALRVLEYPPGTGSHTHTDFDLFTVNLWRSEPNAGLPVGPYHMGELGELLRLGPATPHRVDPVLRVQRSLVYFAVPDHAAVLPSGMTVGQWMDERKKRSRYTR